MNGHSQIKWVELKPMKYARQHPGLHVLDADRVVVSGGGPPEVFTLSTGTWSMFHGTLPRPGAALPGAGRSVRVQLGGGRLLRTGGMATYGGGPFEERDSSIAECWLEQPEERAGTLTFARHDHGAVVLPCGAIFIAGGMRDEDSRPTNRIELGVPRGVVVAIPGVHEKIAREADEQWLERVVESEDWPEVERLARKLGDQSRLARALLAQGRPREAAQVLEHETSEFTLVILGDALIACGETAKAAQVFEHVIFLCEQQPTWTHQVLRHARSQLQYLKPSTKNAPTATSADWNNKGAAYSREGEHVRALKCFEQALRLEPDNDYAHGNRASALIALKRPKEALAAIRRAIALREHDRERRSDGYLVLGIALYDLARWRESVKAYDEGISLHPTKNHFNNRGNSLLKLKRYEEALTSFEQGESHWGRASALCYLGRLIEARAAVAQCERGLEPKLRKDPDLAPLYRKAG